MPPSAETSSEASSSPAPLGASPSSTRFPSPRSASFTTPFTTSTFAGLTSRCATPTSLLCRCASASTICANTVQISGSSSGFFASRRARTNRRRSPPSAHSNTITRYRSSRNESSIRTTLPCVTFPRSCTSRRHRSRFLSGMPRMSTFFTATGSPSETRAPLYTTAYPPLPTALPTRYLARRCDTGSERTTGKACRSCFSRLASPRARASPSSTPEEDDPVACSPLRVRSPETEVEVVSAASTSGWRRGDPGADPTRECAPISRSTVRRRPAPSAAASDCGVALTKKGLLARFVRRNLDQLVSSGQSSEGKVQTVCAQNKPFCRLPRGGSESKTPPFCLFCNGGPDKLVDPTAPPSVARSLLSFWAPR